MGGLTSKIAPARFTIADVNLTSRQREALRKEKSAAKRTKREERRQQKAAAPVEASAQRGGAAVRDLRGQR